MYSLFRIFFPELEFAYFKLMNRETLKKEDFEKYLTIEEYAKSSNQFFEKNKQNSNFHGKQF